MASLVTQDHVVYSDPDILGGTLVFIGARVPMQALIDYLEGGHTVDEFLEGFPSVSRKQALAILREAKRMLLENACTT